MEEKRRRSVRIMLNLTEDERAELWCEYIELARDVDGYKWADFLREMLMRDCKRCEKWIQHTKQAR